jgi:hypothetical protein
MMRRLGVLVLLFTTMCGMGLAQGITLESTPPSRAQVLKLMSAMGIQQSVDASLKGMQGKIRAAARASFQKKYPDADDATLKKLDEVFNSTELFGFDALSEPLVAAYQKNLSASDVQAGIDFYSSDAGQRLLEKVPLIIREASESGGKQVQLKLAVYSEELEHKLAVFQSEVDNQKPAANKSNAAGDQSKATDEKSK